MSGLYIRELLQWQWVVWVDDCLLWNWMQQAFWDLHIADTRGVARVVNA
jgi:hypothetical protein